MKLNTVILISLGVLLLVFIFLIYFWVWPIGREIYSGMKVYETRVAYRDDYKQHTTPLSESVVEDICLKLEIETQNESCKPGAVVYAPELFDELKRYFNNLPDVDKTYTTVKNRLDPYLVNCERPDSDGYFRCKYDFRGDRVYPVFFFFDKKGFYWQIIANTGGS